MVKSGDFWFLSLPCPSCLNFMPGLGIRAGMVYLIVAPYLHLNHGRECGWYLGHSWFSAELAATQRLGGRVHSSNIWKALSQLARLSSVCLCNNAIAGPGVISMWRSLVRRIIFFWLLPVRRVLSCGCWYGVLLFWLHHVFIVTCRYLISISDVGSMACSMCEVCRTDTSPCCRIFAFLVLVLSCSVSTLGRDISLHS